MPGVMGNDPALEEPRRNRKPSLPRSDRLQGKAAKPAAENGIADFRPQPIAAAPPGFAKRRRAGTPSVKAIRVGLIIHVHSLTQARGGQSTMRRCQGTGHGWTLYVCVQGNPPALHPLTPLLWREPSSGPSNPSDILKQG